jgi:Protein similar to CwfJ C-terminus 2/Protein similar to CwfJ C-terminus 1
MLTVRTRSVGDGEVMCDGGVVGDAGRLEARNVSRTDVLYDHCLVPPLFLSSTCPSTTMGLDDFERELAQKQEKPRDSHKRRHRSRSRDRSHRHKHPKSSHRDRPDDERKRYKRRRRSDDEDDQPKEKQNSRRTEDSAVKVAEEQDDEDDDWVEKGADAAPPGEDTLDNMLEEVAEKNMQRDSWMQAPSSLDIDYVQRKKKEPKSHFVKSAHEDYEKKKHQVEVEHQLKDLEEDEKEDAEEELSQEELKEDVSYTFGDSGSAWRMTKLKNVYRQAKESNKGIEEAALEIYGDLKYFDEAREEEIELDRRKRYGEGYRWKEKPDGELHAKRIKDTPGLNLPSTGGQYVSAIRPQDDGPVLDQSELNKLKAKMMKAKLRKAPDADALEEEYNKALQAASCRGPEVIQLNAMENRMLAGSRQGEVSAITTKRGQERGQVVENDDMTIEDMVRQERRTKGRAEGQALAERISKDGKFTDDLDYMDENAEKLAKYVHKSNINLRSIAIEDYQKMKRALDNCPLCHNEEKETRPIAPVISLGTRIYLTLATEPELAEGGAVLVPIEHHKNLLECDDDEWEELRNFMKCLMRMYHDQGRAVLFYENSAMPGRGQHAAMVVVPLPYSLGEMAPAFFREAILASDEEWSQHKKIIDTAAKARNGLGRRAFRNSIAKEMPYFHVWFELDGGLGHVVEDSGRWPKGDLFAREVIGGMLDVDAATIKRQGRWHKSDGRVDGFRKRWRKFDWTRVLTDG